jgi:hypothetical protein
VATGDHVYFREAATAPAHQAYSRECGPDGLVANRTTDGGRG